MLTELISKSCEILPYNVESNCDLTGSLKTDTLRRINGKEKKSNISQLEAERQKKTGNTNRQTQRKTNKEKEGMTKGY